MEQKKFWFTYITNFCRHAFPQILYLENLFSHFPSYFVELNFFLIITVNKSLLETFTIHELNQKEKYIEKT